MNEKQVQQLFQLATELRLPGGIQTRKQLDFSKRSSMVKRKCFVERTKVHLVSPKRESQAMADERASYLTSSSRCSFNFIWSNG
jgi:hypothetical protein